MTKPRHLKLHFRRFEFKYMLTKEQSHQIKKQAQKFLTSDPFSKPTGAYAVNSLYFDSPDLRFYHDVEAGLENRIKIRYRYYNQDKNLLFWEIKRKQNADVFKDRCLVLEPTADIINKINFFQKKFSLKPIVWVSYIREPYVTKSGQFRLTFDSELTGSRPIRVNPMETENRKASLLPWEILEVKFSGKLPFWMYKILQSHNLERQALSKYRLAIEKVVV